MDLKQQIPFIIGVSVSSFFIIIILFFWILLSVNKKNKKNVLKKKSEISENFVNESVKFWAHKNNSMFIPSSMFKYQSNKIFEVDGILINQRALIAIEVKSIDANTIEGNGYEKTWFKTLGNEKFSIKSPIEQNDKHLDHIMKMTNMKIPMVSLIVFDNNSVQNLNITEIPSHVVVIKSNKIETTLNGISSVLLPKITQKEVQSIYFKLMEHKTESDDDKKLLISYAKEFDEKTFTI